MCWSQKVMGFYCISVLFFSFVMLLTINLIHPDLFNIQLRRDVKAHENNEHIITHFI